MWKVAVQNSSEMQQSTAMINKSTAATVAKYTSKYIITTHIDCTKYNIYIYVYIYIDIDMIIIITIIIMVIIRIYMMYIYIYMLYISVAVLEVLVVAGLEAAQRLDDV